MKVCFLVYFYVAVIKYWQKKPSRGKRFILAYCSQFIMKEAKARTQGSNLNAGTKTEAIEGLYLLAFSA